MCEGCSSTTNITKEHTEMFFKLYCIIWETALHPSFYLGVSVIVESCDGVVIVARTFIIMVCGHIWHSCSQKHRTFTLWRNLIGSYKGSSVVNFWMNQSVNNIVKCSQIEGSSPRINVLNLQGTRESYRLTVMLELMLSAWCSRLAGSSWLWFSYYLNLFKDRTLKTRK